MSTSKLYKFATSGHTAYHKIDKRDSIRFDPLCGHFNQNLFSLIPVLEEVIRVYGQALQASVVPSQALYILNKKIHWGSKNSNRFLQSNDLKLVSVLKMPDITTIQMLTIYQGVVIKQA